VSESAHVRAGGSKAHRILACPASLRLEEEAGPDRTSGDAQLGTAAHSLLESVLRLGTDGGAAAWVGTPIVVDGKTFVVDGEMAEAVQVAVDWVVNVMATCRDAKLMLEQRVTWAALNPAEEMRGSADIIIVLPSLGRLVVADYKHGQGKLVEARRNPQGMYYAVGALLDPAVSELDIREVQVSIIQPRAYHPDGPVRSDTITAEELYAWSVKMLDAVRQGQSPDAPAVPGPHCTFCRAEATCTARADGALALAQDEFAVELVRMPAKAMDPQAVVDALQKLEPMLDAAETWAKGARAFLHARAVAGEAVPGYKLVPTRPARVWNNLDEVKVFAELAGLSQDEYEPRALVSPAQMEKLVGKKQLPAELYSSVSSGLNLVRESSEGTPVARISAADEFSTQ
jgi:hypothetical protein